jgi:hypothetical protein
VSRLLQAFPDRPEEGRGRAHLEKNGLLLSDVGDSRGKGYFLAKIPCPVIGVKPGPVNRPLGQRGVHGRMPAARVNVRQPFPQLSYDGIDLRAV